MFPAVKIGPTPNSPVGRAAAQEGLHQSMPKMVTYRLDGYDGGLALQPEPSAEGLLQLTNTHWGLSFPDHDVGITGGLLRSEFSVEPVDRRRCVLRLTTDGGADSCSMIVLAPAEKLDEVVSLRMASLIRVRDDVERVADGQWWRDPEVFAELGMMRSTSISGIRYEGGWWKNDRIRPTRWRAVLDFTAEGLVLRDWRRRLCLPWALIDSIEVVDGPAGSTYRHRAAKRRGSGSQLGATIVVRSPSGRIARFSSSIMTADDVRLRLAPIIQRLDAAPVQLKAITSTS